MTDAVLVGTGPDLGERQVDPASVHIGLDIGGTKVLGVALGPDDEVLADVRLGSEPGPDKVVDVAAAAARELAERIGAPLSALAGIGIGIPGVVDVREGVLSHAVNLGVGGDGLPLAARLSRRPGSRSPSRTTSTPPRSAPPAPSNSTAPIWPTCPSAPGSPPGSSCPGTSAAAPAAARARSGTSPSTRPDRCAPAGSAAAWKPSPPAARSPARGRWSAAFDASESPAAALFRSAAAGTPRPCRVRTTIADHLAAAVQLLVLTVDVDVVVLGGGVSEVGEQLRLAVANGLSQRGRTSPFLASLNLPARITLAPTGRPIAALGAALLAPGREPV